ncbi:MAG: hypothetical protein KKB21_00110 [Nanoarchaeota archaeon]|nr:hypothetical protein [Nanoarchaeota archaeon]MBU4085962.1 hypothetical protein [Nanoarchaeota archaeon]
MTYQTIYDQHPDSNRTAKGEMVYNPHPTSTRLAEGFVIDNPHRIAQTSRDLSSNVETS